MSVVDFKAQARVKWIFLLLLPFTLAIVWIIRGPSLSAPYSPISVNHNQSLQATNIVQRPKLLSDPGGKHCFTELEWELCCANHIAHNPPPPLITTRWALHIQGLRSLGGMFPFNTEMINSATVVESQQKSFRSVTKPKKILLTIQRISKTKEELEGQDGEKKEVHAWSLS